MYGVIWYVNVWLLILILIRNSLPPAAFYGSHGFTNSNEVILRWILVMMNKMMSGLKRENVKCRPLSKCIFQHFAFPLDLFGLQTRTKWFNSKIFQSTPSLHCHSFATTLPLNCHYTATTLSLHCHLTTNFHKKYALKTIFYRFNVTLLPLRCHFTATWLPIYIKIWNEYGLVSKSGYLLV